MTHETPIDTTYAPGVLAQYEHRMWKLIRELPGSGNVNIATFGHHTIGTLLDDLQAIKDYQVGMVERYEADRTELEQLRRDLAGMRRLLNG
jgi:hypothetical protein